MTVLLAKALELRDYGHTNVAVKQIDFKFFRHRIINDEEVMEHTKERRTKQDALEKETDHIYTANTFKDLVRMAHQASVHMVEMGLFKGQIIPILDVAEDSKSDTDLKLTFVVQEPRSVHASISLGCDNYGETSGNLQCSVPSTFGRGEECAAQISQGWRGTTLFNFSVHKPLLGWQRYTSLGQTVYRTSANVPWSGYNHITAGLSTELWHRHSQKYKNIEQTLRWHYDWRQLYPEKNASFVVREHAGHSLKSSLEHSVQLNTQDNDILPQKGVLAKLITELAGFGFGGDVRYLRNQLQFQATTPLPYAGAFLSCGLQGTYIQPRGGRTLHMLDRTYLGGPTDLRGFSMARAGPVAQDNAIGGNASWAAALHIYRGLYPRNIVFGHIFACAGNVHPVDYRHSSAGLIRTINRMTADPRVSVGAGVAVRVSNLCRLELNYCVPVRARTTDGARPGFQFGAGVAFL